MVVLLVVLTGGISHGIMRLIHPVDWLYFPIASIMVYYGLASHSLIAEALKVNRLLNRKGTNAARKQLSNIVGRDTGQLSPNQIRIAALETLAENLSDGGHCSPLLLCHWRNPPDVRIQDGQYHGFHCRI